MVKGETELERKEIGDVLGRRWDGDDPLGFVHDLGLSTSPTLNSQPALLLETCIPMFIAALFTIAKIWKQSKCPSVDEWIRKLWYIYTTEEYAAERRRGLFPFATAWMELESIMLREISQAVRDRYHMISPLTGP